MRRCLVAFLLVPGLLWTVIARGAEISSPDQQLLKAAGLPTDGGGLLAFFHMRTHPEEERALIPSLIEQLGAGTSDARNLAAGRLVALGPAAVPLLRQAAKDPDEPAIMTGAQRCLAAIQNAALPAAAARLLRPLRPAGAAQTLLDYLPFADDESVVEEIESTLTEIARRKDRLDRDLQAAMQDRVPVRRSVAAVAICRGAGPGRADLVRKLLRDPKPTVRLQVALALGAINDEAAIPVLIDLLDALPPGQATQALQFLSALAGEQAASASGAPLQSGRIGRVRRDAWAEWWHQAGSAELVDYFRKRTLGDADRDRILTLIRQLGDDAFDVREKATANLIALGSQAAALLRQAARSNDIEVAERAQKCLRGLNREQAPFTPASAARLLAIRKPPEAAEVLLGYVPFADDEASVEAVQKALLVVGTRDGKPDPAVLKALEDSTALRRALAAETVCKTVGGDEPAVRKLLKDPDASVRLRVALALAALKVRESIPVLIDLAADSSVEQAWQAQELLLRLAGERPPTPDFGGTLARRREARDAWTTWWHANGAALDLGKLEDADLGYTLLVQADTRSNTGRVGEWGPDGKLRWEITGLRLPTDAQVLPGNRVLIAEQFGMLVSERDFQGHILWQKPVTMPVSCQRLANGNTFIASRNLLLEVDRRDKEIFSYSRPAHDLMSACKLRDGQIVCLTVGSLCLRLDSKGREVASFPIGGTLGGVEPLPNGNFVVAQPMNNRVVEYDVNGKQVRQIAAQMPNSASLLSNGHLLVTSQAFTHVLELDRAGKVVWEMKTDGRPIRARRR